MPRLVLVADGVEGLVPGEEYFAGGAAIIVGVRVGGCSVLADRP